MIQLASTTTVRPAAAQSRALAVDALRGLAILGMVFYAALPLGVLPAWMYHAQAPPPDHVNNTMLPGLTWPDLVFPTFIFTLGVAIPLAATRRLQAGATPLDVVGGAVARGALLVFFALFRQHFDASVSGIEPQRLAWLIGLAAFAVLFAIFVRLPDAWSRGRRSAVRAAGWIGAAAMFGIVGFPDGSRFTPERIDIILLLLAYCATFGTLVWLATRDSLLARLAVLAAIASLRIVGYNPGWVNALYAFDPVPWLYKFSFFQFLCVVIPGTIVGDMLLRWMRESGRGPEGAGGWDAGRLRALAALAVAALPVTVIGVQARYVFATTVAAALLSAAAGWVTRYPLTATESLIHQLVRWASFWLLLGLLLDPFDGGTKKVPETFAWFFQGTGVAMFLLVAFLLAFSGRRPRPLQLLVDNGQNPMLAYVMFGMVILPLLGLTTAKQAIDAMELAPAAALSWSVAVTLAVAVAVSAFTRRKVFWRS